jgi:hypothetical protein
MSLLKTGCCRYHYLFLKPMIFHCPDCISAVFTAVPNTIHSFIPVACTECDSLPFSGASSNPVCYIPFPSTLFHQLGFHPPSLHLVISFLVYLTSFFPDSYIILFCKFCFFFFHSQYMTEPTCHI